MSDWGLQTGTTATTTWKRSWRQELFTDLGADFRIVAHLEEVTTFESGQETVHKALPGITRSASNVMSDPDVQLLNEVLTRLIKKWMDEDNGVVPEVVDPLVPPVDPPVEPPVEPVV